MKSYLKFLSRNKLYTAIEAVGLAVSLAFVSIIGIPLAVYAAQEYLKEFIYRLEGYGWIFVPAVVITLVFSLFSVLWQTLKAAKTNPAMELKKE